jgi:nitroreductase
MEIGEFINIISCIPDITQIKQKDIPENELIQLFEAYKQAPSAANSQPGEFYLVYNKNIRKKMLEAILDPFMRNESDLKPEWVLKTPVVMVVCMNIRRARARLGEKGDDIAKMDIWGGIQNLRISANILGIGTSICRELDAVRLSEVLNLPKFIKPIGIIGLGYLDDKSIKRENERPLLENSMFIHTIKES